MYDFEGTCNYIFAAICKDASSPTFSVQLRRGPGGDISRVIVELGASVVTVQQGAISIKDVGAVSLPYTSNGLQITPFGQSVRLVAKQLELELVVMWGPGAHLMVLVEDRHMGRMCGLCGNFDGEKTNEFLNEDGTHLEPHKYAALQKLDDPNEICTHEAIPGPRVLQAEHCPANQVYQECGEACVKTCSNPQHSCARFCTFGCFCPEGGSFVTTFDARPYRFHGTCTYTLLQSPQLPDGGSLMAAYDKSGYSHSETSLVALIYVSSQDKIVISQDELVTNHGDTKWLPYKTGNITVFKQTSTHLQMATTFGLELVVQLQPVFQAYVTVGPQFRGQTRAVPCTGNQTYSYDSRACGRTCFSLSDRAAECHPSAVPVEGCNTHKLILAGQSTVVEGVIWCVRVLGGSPAPCSPAPGRPLTRPLLQLLFQWAAELPWAAVDAPGYVVQRSGALDCEEPWPPLSPPHQPPSLQPPARPPRHSSPAASPQGTSLGPCAPTCQMLATGTPCVPTKCEPGCVCAEGLYENASGQCVPPEECPCEFAGVSYPRGAELHTDCKACTCSRGKWVCQQSAHCSSTCTLYGEGHVVTFDGQRFVFEGSCEYILATDGCGTNDSRPTFKILTENVVCGKSGVTCSRAIRMFLGGLSIVLADRNYTVSGTDPQVHFRVRAGSLHLVLDVTIGSSYNLTLIWNKHMTVSIKISRASQDALCGLCGNYNGNMKDDFETRSKYVASSELEFVNSWKESPLCGDARLALDPCSLTAFRRAWAERKCSIINSQTFAACHSLGGCAAGVGPEQVYRLPYYEACVRDTCGCDTGGDCECLCDAVAAYAKACLDKGVCVDWRAPDFCPIYCDFYNSHTRAGDGQYQHTPETNCTWHYRPCLCPQQLQSLPDTNIEGCYNCSQDEYFDQDTGTCVQCKVCRVRELEEEVTYQGCTANVTVTRCEGICASSASFNAYTNQVDTLCSCCHPLGSYEKQLVLPCPDPGAPGKQLVLTLQVFKRCVCGPWRCRDQGQPPW
ncbi:Mucin-6 [Myotis davidii]|uniref:Mucin-6 n=1 Tax=Myotis davidii TaxID=225400 RepID=L5M0A3_MYODS|nr:Mucin-6 [Myotis davidii]